MGHGVAYSLLNNIMSGWKKEYNEEEKKCSLCK